MSATSWLRARPDDFVPGFRVTPQDAVPGFNLDENGVPRQAANRADRMLMGSASPFPGSGAASASQGIGTNFQQPDPSVMPDWLSNLLAMPLPTTPDALDPRTGQPIVPYAPLIRPATFNPTEDQDVPGSEDTDPDADRPDPDLPPDPEPSETKPNWRWPPWSTTAGFNAPAGPAAPQWINVPPAPAQATGNAPFLPPSRPNSSFQMSGNGRAQPQWHYAALPACQSHLPGLQ